MGIQLLAHLIYDPKRSSWIITAQLPDDINQALIKNGIGVDDCFQFLLGPQEFLEGVFDS